MKVYIVMTVHNRAELTLACLSYVADQSYTDYEVVVVDDGSTDNTSTLIAEQYPEVTVLQGDGNLWWTGGMNKGISYVLEHAHDTDAIVTLNDDTYFEQNYIANLVHAAQKHPGACVGSLLKNYFQKEIIEDSGVKINWNGYTYYQIPFDETKKEVAVDTLSCRGALIPVSAMKNVGMFDVRHLPHYNADYDFFIRAERQGVPLYMSYDAVIYNKEDLNSKKKRKSIWWRMFNRKSSSNIGVHYFMILKRSPSKLSAVKNLFAYTGRSITKLWR